MVLFICIAIPALFLIGMIYSALKEQLRLEREVLKPLVEKRRAEREAMLKYYEGKGDLKSLNELKNKPLFDPGDDDSGQK